MVTTDVGGNREVVSSPELGQVVPFGDGQRLTDAIANALRQTWDRARIRRHAEDNTWDKRIDTLEAEFHDLLRRRAKPPP